MRKNRWLLLVLALAAAMLLAACAQPAAENENEGAENEAAENEAAQPTEAMTEAVEPTEAPTEAMTEAPTEAATEQAAAGEIDCKGASEGDEVTMFYQWSGQEEERLQQVLQPLVEACGIVITPEATRDPAVLDTRIQGGTPPDIVFWNLPQVQQYADQIVPVTDLGVNADNYADFWREAATFDGAWLALPVKADIKTIIWYSPANFTALGYEVPETWDELDALVEQMVADGLVPWSMGLESEAATGWTGTDFIQDILLVTQGPDYVNSLIAGDIPYNDEGVREAYELYGKWAMDPQYTVGGATGTLETSFRDAIYLPFSDPPEAMMVKQSGFAGGEVQTQFPDLQYGVDYDFFGFPGAQGVQGGSDWMFAFSDAPAVQAVFAYLSSDLGGQNWAAAGFALTPNLAGADSYIDPQLQKQGAILAAAQGFTPDIGDTIPGGFGSAEFEAIVNYLNGADLQGELDRLAQIQAEARGD